MALLSSEDALDEHHVSRTKDWLFALLDVSLAFAGVAAPKRHLRLSPARRILIAFVIRAFFYSTRFIP